MQQGHVEVRNMRSFDFIQGFQTPGAHLLTWSGELLLCGPKNIFRILPFDIEDQVRTLFQTEKYIPTTIMTYSPTTLLVHFYSD